MLWNYFFYVPVDPRPLLCMLGLHGEPVHDRLWVWRCPRCGRVDRS
jgi:hypothetical protein